VKNPHERRYTDKKSCAAKYEYMHRSQEAVLWRNKEGVVLLHFVGTKSMRESAFENWGNYVLG
jgi:hypothetical protein